MTLQALKPGQVYVAVRTVKEWDVYPTPPELVARSTILSIFHSENTSEYVLVYYSFSRNSGLVPMTAIHIFDWATARQTKQSGLSPAYVP